MEVEAGAIEAENAVLGAMLLDAAVVAPVLALLGVDDFTGEPRRTLFAAIQSLYRAGEPTDAITVVDRAGWTRDAEKRAYVAELLDVTPTSANAMEHARIVREQATLRRIQAQTSALLTARRLEDCRQPVAAMTEALGAGEQVDAWTMEQMLTEFGDRQASGKPREYIGIGIAEIDANTYLERGDVMMIGAEPSGGKTAFGLNCAYHIARDYNVGFYSLETRREKITDRLMASCFRISFDAIKKGKLSEADWLRFAQESIDASRRRLTVLHAAGMTVQQIATSARARGFDVIFIDYGQLIAPMETKDLTRADQYAEISKALHVFAQSTKTLVVILLQLVRKERGSSRARDMTDLGGSSQWERDADLILLLDYPQKGERLDPDDLDSPELTPETSRILRIAKQKEGKRVDLPLCFDGDHQRFSVMIDEKKILRRFTAQGREIKERLHREAQKKQAKQMTFAEVAETGDEPF